MHLVFGLGNPGEKYLYTRHNVGFMTLDRLADLLSVSFRWGKGPYVYFDTKWKGEKLIGVKPLTFMNRSGIAVEMLVREYGIPLSRLLVVSDDFHLPLGKIRLRKKGTSGGHQGLASIIHALGTEEFLRLRMGIGMETGTNPSEYVLSKFSKRERPIVQEMIQRGVEAILHLIEYGMDKTMTVFNRA